jgi:hypothetical protein
MGSELLHTMLHTSPPSPSPLSHLRAPSPAQPSNPHILTLATYYVGLQSQKQSCGVQQTGGAQKDTRREREGEAQRENESERAREGREREKRGKRGGGGREREREKERES